MNSLRINKSILRIIITLCVLPLALKASAWVGEPLPRLHVDGRYLKDPHGNIVNLHNVAMTTNNWFSVCYIGVWRQNNYDVARCLKYNEAVKDRLTD